MQDLFELVPCWQIYFKISSFAREKSGNFKKWCERVYVLSFSNQNLPHWQIPGFFFTLNHRDFTIWIEGHTFDLWKQSSSTNCIEKKSYIKKSTCEIFIIYIFSSISQNIQIGFFHSSQNNSCRILIVFSRIDKIPTNKPKKIPLP